MDRQPMTTSAAERLATQSYNKLIPPKTEPFKVIELSPRIITTDEDGTRNTVSIDGATLVSPAKFADRQIVYMPEQPVNERDEKVDEGGRQTTAE